MQVSDKLICGSVYDYLSTRIMAGLLSDGEKLPSILELSGAFHLAPETIRAALLILAEDGYIRMEAKQGSWVTYQADRAAREEAVARYYAQRCDGIQDLRRSAPYLLEPLLTHALREMDDSCRTRLRENWEAGRKDQIISPAIRLCALLLSVLNNSLILNLFWEVDRYLRFSCLSVSDAYDAVASAMFQNDRDNEAGRSDKVLYDAGGTIRQIIGICHEARGRYPAEEQVPFHWTIYRQRRQLGYTLAARIIRKIPAGVYPIGSYLPPLPKMAEELDVSVRTLRRTLSILSSLGVTRSFHGKGTLVCMEVEDIEFSRPEIKEGLRYYWESLQFLSLTAGPVSLHMLRTMPEADSDSLTAQFNEMCERDRCHRCFDIVLDFIAERCPLAMVRECYGALQEFLAWGYPFTVHRLRNHSLQSEYAQTIGQAADCLTRRDWEGFSGKFGALMAREARLAEMILTDYCKQSPSGDGENILPEITDTIEVHP